MSKLGIFRIELGFCLAILLSNMVLKTSYGIPHPLYNLHELSGKSSYLDLKFVGQRSHFKFFHELPNIIGGFIPLFTSA
jgi:hypothetical protein